MPHSDDEKLGIAMGANLRKARERFGLSLRDVQERSEVLASTWGHKEYQISASWLARIEGGNSGISAFKLIALSAIYSLSPGEMLELCSPQSLARNVSGSAGLPNATVLLHAGALHEHARTILSEDLLTADPPEFSHLLSRPESYPDNYRRGVVGLHDNTMEPMIRPGSIVLIDTQRRTIAKRNAWNHEFDRPIYFLLTRDRYLTGFCELDREGEWLTLVPHALSRELNSRWRFRREIEVIGEVTAFVSRRGTIRAPAQAR